MHRGRDRRRSDGEFRVRPRRSPANLLILTVVGALVGSAAVATLMGGGLEETTPHGMLLSGLRSVADGQDAHRDRHGEFAGWLRSLEIEEPLEIELIVVAGDSARWEAVARHPVGLTCTQSGRVERGRSIREEPVCFTSLR